MSKFRKKPVVIEAVRWNGEAVGLTNGGEPFGSEKLELPAWMPKCEVFPTSALASAAATSLGAGSVTRSSDWLYIGTLEGTHAAAPGDWIIRGIKGELYPCKPDIFDATYDAVEG